MLASFQDLDIPLLLQSPLFSGFIFCVGLCIGSFLNVCIYRIPLDRPVSYPGSHCAVCGSPIEWKNNIPVLSWWLLRGRAACCGTRIDWRYWLVEALTAFLFLILWWKFTPEQWIAYAVFASGLVCATCIDIDHFMIPDRFTLGGMLAGFIFSALIPSLHDKATAWEGFVESFRGAFFGFAILWGVSLIGSFVFRKEAMGAGDFKFLGAMGAFLGIASIGWIIVISSIVGSVFGLAIIFGKQGTWGTRIPYGPFLAIAAMAYLFGGKEITYDWLSNFQDRVMKPVEVRQN
ncbi:MAG TPA: A24 family peptidase [Candidatus Methylacidiphilales bacterium]|nr:A24 family peptidase [Candidatus Methylacidiphilales bacterium]